MKTRAFGFYVLFCLAALPAAARPLVGITVTGTTNQLIQFDSAAPGTASVASIGGLVSGDVIEGIDFRPSNGVLYALVITHTVGADTGRIYTIDIATAAATVVGSAPFSTTLTSGKAYGFDFNPTVDRIRVVNTANQNFRVNPDTGLLAGTDTNPTGPVVGAAYDRNHPQPATATTLFGIDFANNLLVRIGGVDGNPSPNGGALTTIGPLGVTLSNVIVGFDIAEDGVAYASLPTLIAGSVTYRLYTVNLSTGAVSAVGNIGTGLTQIRGIAAVPSAVANIDSGKFFATIQAAINDAQTLN